MIFNEPILIQYLSTLFALITSIDHINIQNIYKKQKQSKLTILI